MRAAFAKSIEANPVAFRPDPTLGYSGFYFNGDIAEMLIFSRVLTSSEELTVNASADAD